MSLLEGDPAAVSIVAHAHPFVVGVDTHARTHDLAILVAATGELLASEQFTTTSAGLNRAIAWVGRWTGGDLETLWVIEGVATYGARVARIAAETGYQVVEALRMSARSNRGIGKSDPLDAHRIAAAALPLDVAKLRHPRQDDGLRADGFLANLDTAGSLQWIKAGRHDLFHRLTTDTAGNRVAVGTTAGEMGVIRAGGMDALAVSLTATGALTWVDQWDTAADDLTSCIARRGGDRFQRRGPHQVSGRHRPLQNERRHRWTPVRHHSSSVLGAMASTPRGTQPLRRECGPVTAA